MQEYDHIIVGAGTVGGTPWTDEVPRDFGAFDGRVWLNCAHQGPLPRVAADEAREAIAWKLAPYELTADRFNGVPARLKAALARLVGASAEEIILGNSASYGLHLLANGMPWREGDEILVLAVAVYRDRRSREYPEGLLPDAVIANPAAEIPDPERDPVIREALGWLETRDTCHPTGGRG